MNLTDLQKELRSMEERLSVLQKEVEGMKPKTAEEKKTDFERITKLAMQHPIKGAKVSRVSPALQKEYMQVLSWLMLSAENSIYDRLLYICRIAAGCGMEIQAEELYCAGLEFQPEDMEKICLDFQELKYAFLTDALVIANLSGEASEKDISLIADIARMFGCERWEIQITGLIAKGILTDHWDVLEKAPVPQKGRWKICDNFKELIPEEWVISHRRECGRLCVEQYEKDVNVKDLPVDAMKWLGMNSYQIKRPCIIKNRLQMGKLVKKGDVIVTYEEEIKEASDTLSDRMRLSGMRVAPFYSQKEPIKQKKTITAPCDGIVFFLEDSKKKAETGQGDKYIIVYVVSYFDNYQDFSEWYRKNNKI